MELSIFIAKVLAVVYLSLSLGFIVSGDYYKKNLEKVLEDAGIFYFAPIMVIIIGSLIIHNHNIWEKNWTVLVTIFGWIALVKGVTLLVFPRYRFLFSKVIKPENLSKFVVFPLIIGLVFGYFGFLAQ